jgi:hypothetical protein
VALFWPNLPFRRLTSREAERSLRRKPRRDRFERRLAIFRTCLTVVHLTALQARSAVKASRSDDIDLPEPAYDDGYSYRRHCRIVRDQFNRRKIRQCW